MVNLSDIIYIQSDNNYARFVLTNNHKILVSQTLKSYDEKLKGLNFFRSHQSFLVNLNFIRSIDNKKETIQLSTGDVLPIAHSKRKKLIDFLDLMY